MTQDKSYIYEGTVTQIISLDIAESKRYVSILFLNNKILLLDNEANQFCILNINFTGVMHCILFDKEDLYFSCTKNQLVKINIEELDDKKVCELWFDPSSENNDNFFQIMKCEGSHISKNMNFIKWIEKDKLLLCGNEDGLYLNDFEFLSHSKNEMMQLTACGVSLNPEKSLVAVGDFTGFFRIF
jgi:hypothetical protein